MSAQIRLNQRRGCSGWNSLPQYYRNIQQFNLDPFIAPNVVGTEESLSDNSPVSNRHAEGIEASQPAPTSVESEDTQPAAASVECKASVSVGSLQSKVRQTLFSISELKYVTDDMFFLQKQLQHLQPQLKAFNQHSSASQKKVLFRISHHTVQKNIRASFLRRCLAAARARRAARHKLCMLRKSKVSGYNFFWSTDDFCVVP